MKFKDMFNGKKSQQGFTLMEMLIVLFIIGVLITIVMPNLTNAGEKAQNKTCEANKRVILAQAEAYYLEKGQVYPRSVQELIDEGYLRDTPFCPLENEEDAATSYQLLVKDNHINVICIYHDQSNNSQTGQQ